MTNRNDGRRTDAPASDAGTFLILVVDDDIPVAEAVVYMLEEFGFRTLIAHNGREALALVHDHRPDLVITDLMMPMMNGSELIQALRTHGKAPPIVLMTAAGGRYAASAGADAVLAKPFDIKDVEALLARLLPAILR